MEYEHKNKIKHDLEHLNEYGLISGVYKLKQKLNELDEVYAKAQAWDDFVATMDYNYPTYEDRKRGITWDNPNHVVRQFSAVIDRYEGSEQDE